MAQQALRPEQAHCMAPVHDIQSTNITSSITKLKRGKAAKLKAGKIPPDAAKWDGLVTPDSQAMLHDIAMLGAGLVDCILPVET